MVSICRSLVLLLGLLILLSVNSVAQSEDTVIADKIQTGAANIIEWKKHGQALGIEQEAFRRFIAASSFFAKPTSEIRKVTVYYYDLVTACVISGTYSTNKYEFTNLGLYRTHQVGSEFDILKISITTFTNFLNIVGTKEGALNADQSCSAAINNVYGNHFGTALNKYAALSKETKEVLNSKNPEVLATDNPSDLVTLTKSRLKIAGKFLVNPEYLSCIESVDGVILVFGDPAGTVRWLSQFKKVDPDGWNFQGGVDAVVLNPE